MSLISNPPPLQPDIVLHSPQEQQHSPSQTVTLADPINITLQPPSVKRGHRHRRSAAISGDFDSSSFLQPPPPSSSLNLSKSFPCSPVKSNINSIADMLNSKESILASPATANNSNTGNANQNYNYNSYSFASSPSHLSTPIKFYLTEETKFSNSNSNIPDALINLDDINNNTSNNYDSLSSSLPNLNPSSNSTISTPTPLPTPKFVKKTFSLHDMDKTINHLPKHSLLCSPKKTDVMIVEEITEENNTFDLDTPTSNNNNSDIEDLDIEEDDSYENIIPSSTFSNNQFEVNSLLMNKNLNNSLTSIPTKNSNNSSSNSINSNPNPFSNMNTSSISSLKGKVRYQSYYNLAPSTPKNNHHSHHHHHQHHIHANNSNSNLNNTSSNYHKLNNSMSMSPIKPVVKSPFQYQSLQYELPDDFHQKNNILEDLINEQGDDKEVTLTTDIITPQNTTVIVDSEVINTAKNTEKIDINKTKTIKNNSDSTFLIDDKAKNSLKSSSCSTLSNRSNTNLPSGSSKGKHHERSSSLFSILSKKISHHRRKSSIVSNFSKKSTSIIEQTNDDLLGLNRASQNININNDSTLNEDLTLTPDFLGEPGPMVDIGENDIKQLHDNENSLDRTVPAKYVLNNNDNTQHQNGINSHSNKKGLFSWIVKSKKNRVSSA